MPEPRAGSEEAVLDQPCGSLAAWLPAGCILPLYLPVPTGPEALTGEWWGLITAASFSKGATDLRVLLFLGDVGAI